MTIPKITKIELFITNKNKLSSKYTNEVINTKKYMALKTAYKLIDYVYNNAQEDSINSVIYFAGDEDLAHFEKTTKSCITYIRNKDKENNTQTKITLQLTGKNLTEDILKFIFDNQVYLKVIFNENIQPEQAFPYESGLKLITKYLPETFIDVIINPENINYLYNSILYINELGFSKIEIKQDLYSIWTDENFDILEQQLDLLNTYYKEKLDDYTVPDILLNYGIVFKQRILCDYSEIHNLCRTLPLCNLTKKTGCGFNDFIVADCLGNLYTNDQIPFDVAENNIFYVGTVESIDSNKIGYLFEQLSEKTVSSDKLSCKKCLLNNICDGSSIVSNYIITNNLLTVPFSYCRWQQIFFKKINEFIEYFDSAQDNILFKDFFYGTVTRRSHE